MKPFKQSVVAFVFLLVFVLLGLMPAVVSVRVPGGIQFSKTEDLRVVVRSHWATKIGKKLIYSSALGLWLKLGLALDLEMRSWSRQLLHFAGLCIL